ncbi:ImuA family protein [Novipirellula artificiosorum]|uniref:Protein RecA n=1 Tax=Novipirellula artificiosorum TaxID=2528016 RepID=A0A5C6DCX0_9BACT|nr:hypothetical protein [Novipirellula artificiosorum]TWU35083.1 Protein RecA [Novipirellula artificiosorum]
MTAQQTFAFMEVAVPMPKRPAASAVAAPAVAPSAPAVAEAPVAAVAPAAASESAEEQRLESAKEQRLDVPNDRQAILRRLRAQAGCITAADSKNKKTFSTGSSAIDQKLLRGGLRIDAVTEWIAESDSSGAAALAMIVAANCLRVHLGSGPLVIVDSNKTFYPPAAVSLGIPVERMILVRPRCHRDSVWAIDQALRCDAVAAVWAMLDARLDDRDARRFQLAAEQGETTGLFVRPRAVRGRPSFTDVQFSVQRVIPKRETVKPAMGHPLQVTLDRGRGAELGKSVWLQIDDHARLHEVAAPQENQYETAAVHLASQLAHPKSAVASSRAIRQADRKRRA